ncbi:uncharacterized protein LOC127748446 [Arachis duranensis]|uniref:Uncharacterized protein LOC127748446 n=1 Tax=Arachis duranensis TaxID=130453 RepID=A0A9C6TY44_ARADU|nr:uncharacterized protein LOC127748446 [Arachis duranensis]
MKAKVPKDFKAPDMTPYNGTSDPSHHLSNFRSRMYLTDASDVTHCKAFTTTLTKTAIKWFDNLPPRLITNFGNLAKKFLARFSIQKDKARHAPSLLAIKQGDRESLRSYMKRFNKACLDIQNLPTEAAIMGLINDLREGPFSHSISKKHPTSLNEVQEPAEKYINMEENSRLGETSKTEFSYPPRNKDKESRKTEEQLTEKPIKSSLNFSSSRSSRHHIVVKATDDSSNLSGDDPFRSFPWFQSDSEIQWVHEDRITLFTADGLVQIGGSITPRHVSSSDVVPKTIGKDRMLLK